MATIVEKDGRKFLELKKSEVEDAMRSKGWMPPAAQPQQPQQAEQDPVEKLASLAAERQGKIDAMSRQFGTLGWTLAERANQAEQAAPAERWYCKSCTYAAPASDFSEMGGRCPSCGSSNVQR